MIRVFNGKYVIPNDPTRLSELRALPVRSWNSSKQVWEVPFTVEGRSMLLDAGFKIDHLEHPLVYGCTVNVDASGYLILRTMGSKTDVQKSRLIPEFRRYDGQLEAWVLRPTTKNVAYVKGAFPNAHWSESADAIANNKKSSDFTPPKNDFKCQLEQFPHQFEDFHKTRDLEWWAWLWDQGTGKTKAAIDTFAYNAQKGRVNGLLVLAPNSVKVTWQDDELPTHFPSWLKHEVFVWDTGTKYKAEQWILTPSDAVKILIMNIEALSHDSGVKAAALFVGRWKTMMMVDESSVIANHKAKRTKAVVKIGKSAVFRRIGDGTPATESPMELFSQFNFLSPTIFGSNFYAYRGKFAVMGGWQRKQVVGYQNMEELQMILDQHSSRYLKSEVMKDLPEQLFTKRVVQLTDEQRRMYTDMVNELKVESQKGTFQVEHTITKLLRIHQIVGGFMPHKMFKLDPETGEMEPIEHEKPPAIPGGNPKLDELMSIVKQSTDKIIVYCKFRPEMDLITKTLREKYGHAAVVEMRGGMTNDARRSSKSRFQDGDAKFMVAQSRAAGRGLTLTASNTVIYFSNDFSLRVRLQSQDRVYRYGQKQNVLYIDLVAEKTIDEKLLKTLRKKKSLSDLIHGDPTLSWL